MRLAKIKLAGFKSFVDPTVIPFNATISAIAGPNGCGKSNVIDAVRWVMGESSAKNLRGGSSTDVIFSGSSARKPVGQASVELFFDNSDGRVGGEYASYSEISIRRVVGRDGQSKYFLNGVACRRKDITDIFLGTGLGPRSYSIIQQGMISRIIEAKPDELRVFIEEAAGISKYKERRKETENRIRHTRENMERLTDLRQELDKQLQHLDKQAQSAEKFNALQADLRKYEAESWALAWQRLDTEIQQYDEMIRTVSVEQEALQSEYQSHETNLEKKRVERNDAQDKLNQVQEGYYALGADISKIEQNLSHHDERRDELAQSKLDAENELNAASQHLQSDLETLNLIEDEYHILEPEWESIKIEAENAKEQQLSVEEGYEQWRAQWEESASSIEALLREVEVDKTNLSHHETQLNRTLASVEKAREELAPLDETALEAEKEDFQVQLESLTEEAQTKEAALQNFGETRRQESQAIQDLKASLNDANKELQQLIGRKSSLEALQQSALGRDAEDKVKWLEKQSLSAHRQLAAFIQAEPEWSKAVETILGDLLEAICLEDNDPIDLIAEELTEFEHGSLTLLTPQSQGAVSAGASVEAQKLIDCVTLPENASASAMLQDALSGVYVAESICQALTLRQSIAAHESVITKDGLWFGKHFVRVKKGEADAHHGVLAREQALNEINEQISTLETRIESEKATLTEKEDGLFELEMNYEQSQRERNQVERQLSELKSKLSQIDSQISQIHQRKTQLNEQIEQNLAQIDTARSEISTLRTRIGQTVDKLADLNEQKAHLKEQENEYKDRLYTIKQEVAQKREREHEVAIKLREIATQKQSLQSNRERFETQITAQQDKIQNIIQAQENNEAPIMHLKEELELKVAQRVELEQGLSEARDLCHDIENQIEALEKARMDVEKKMNAIRERVENAKMSCQGLRVHRETVEEKIQASPYTLKEIVENMPEEAEEQAWVDHITKIARQIDRLGPINLAAIDEYKAQLERKTYLDAQDEDLNEALTTLENAIHKIDKETRARFKDTFNMVNENFKLLYPKLFGGGQANLGLTGEDLLETGVTIIARPPGKRNSTISQLSGGEKALTAVALVFAIFQLNPAPFCMLDEVDAPLDDNNVSRFCNLVKEMSQSVQVIFISHNKLALEIGQQLQGVTMKEPGVSRIVSVDMEEAAKLVEA